MNKINGSQVSKLDMQTGNSSICFCRIGAEMHPNVAGDSQGVD